MNLAPRHYLIYIPKMFRNAFFLVSLVIFSSNAFAENFPNYFQELVNGEDTSHAEALIESAMHTMIRQVQIPYVGSDQKLNSSHFFKQMESNFQELSQGSNLYISGGVVRSLLGSIYKEVYLAKQADPNVSTESSLSDSARIRRHTPALGISESEAIWIFCSIPHKTLSIKETTVRKDSRSA